MRFHDITVTGTGDRRSARQHESEELVPEAVAIFARLLAQGGRTFRLPIPVDFASHLELHWTQESDSTAMATFWRGQVPITHSVLLAGDDAVHERAVVDAAQRTIVGMLRGATDVEPGFDLRSIEERPVIVSIPLLGSVAHRDDLMLVADMETCLAAAFFSRLEADGR